MAAEIQSVHQLRMVAEWRKGIERETPNRGCAIPGYLIETGKQVNTCTIN